MLREKPRTKDKQIEVEGQEQPMLVTVGRQ